MSNLQQKHYEGFIKAAVVTGLSFPQAINLYKKAAGQGVLPGMEHLFGLKSRAADALGGLGSSLGQHPGLLAGGAAAGGAGLGAGAMGMFGGGGATPPPGVPPGAPPSMDPSKGPATSPNGMPAWAQMLLAGGGGGLAGAGLAGMMPSSQMPPSPEEREKSQQPVMSA